MRLVMPRSLTTAGALPSYVRPARFALALTVCVCALSACESSDPTGTVPYVSQPVPEDANPDELVTEAQSSLVADLFDVPREVELGGTLRYGVSLENTGDSDVALEPCPAFYQAWGESGTAVSETSFLNCEEAPDAIAPGETARFEMELVLDDVETDFKGSVVWYLGHPDSSHRGEMVTFSPVTTRPPSAD